MTVSQPTLATLPATWTDRYLAMLGVERAAPSLEALSELSRAHLKAVLFGTVQSVLRKRATPAGRCRRWIWRRCCTIGSVGLAAASASRQRRWFTSC